MLIFPFVLTYIVTAGIPSAPGADLLLGLGSFFIWIIIDWVICIIWAVIAANSANNKANRRAIYDAGKSLSNIQNYSTNSAEKQSNSYLTKIKHDVVDEQKSEKIIEEPTEISIENLSKPPKFKTRYSFLQPLKYIISNKIILLKIVLPLVLLLILLKVLLTFLTPDFSDPKKVVEKSEQIWQNNDFKGYYKYLASRTKATYKSFNDYIDITHRRVNGLKRPNCLKLTVCEIKMNSFNNYKRYKIVEIDKIDNHNDTSTFYRTVFNENGNWKVIGNRQLTENGQDLMQKGDFLNAIPIFKTASEMDPFSISVRIELVWCYIRNSEKVRHWADSAAYQLNFLLKLDSTNSEIYNTLGAYYSNINYNEKAVNSFLWAVNYSKDSLSIANYYANAAGNAKSYNINIAETYLKKSLCFNKNSHFAWQTYGDLLYSSQRLIEAKLKYEKAIELVTNEKSIDNYTLINLYGYYATVCKKLGYVNIAKEYTIKCVRVYPDKNTPCF